MNFRSTFCQTDECDDCVSPITGRKLKINRSTTKVLVDPAKVSEVPAIAAEWIEAVRSPDVKLKFPHREISAAIRAFSRIESVDDFAQKLDTLMDVGTACEKRPGQKNHIYGWLLRLWSHGVIAIPRDFPFKTKTSLNPNEFMTRGFQWLGDIQNAYGGKNRASVVATLFRVAGRTLGVVEPGDITPETIARVEGAEVRRALAFMVSPLLLVQRDIYGAKVTHSRLSWGLGRAKRKTGIDRTFAWAIQDDPTLSVWQGTFTDWPGDQRQGLALRTHMAERALQYLVDNPHLPRTVEAYCSRKTPINPWWAEWADSQVWAVSSRRNYTNYLADFFDWYLTTALTSEDDFGWPVLSPAHYNPITRLSSRAQQAETHREALPLRYLHELMRIIADDDYAWPKTIRGDYFMWKDPMTGEFSRQWNPVRAYAILIKLMLPLRTYQVRMLDSGEADSERLTGKVWTSNGGPFTPKRGRKTRVRRGFLRKFSDSVMGREFTGFFINTNKTADAGKDQNDRGYEIPWQHDDVIRIAAELREWQEKFNPLIGPLPWQAIHDRTVLRSYTPEMLRMREPACFLFRDPSSVYPSEPVLDSRLQVFWAQLLRELESRVQSRGDRLANGEVIRFVTPQSGANCRANYDLHTLRVSLITAYATEGGVPIQILSKCVAGHATILMTLYYNKPGPAHVTEVLAEAQRKIQQDESTNFLRFLQNEEVRTASPLVIANDVAGKSALERSAPGSWVVGDIGICPVGGSLCHQGRPRSPKGGDRQNYSPVPGGSKNCAQCRFFITGPAFLPGLVARFNAAGVSLTTTAERLRQHEDQIVQLESATFDGQSQEHSGQIGLAYERRDRVLDEIDAIAHTWHALYRLVERCKAAMNAENTSEDGKLALVLSGGIADLRAALAECTEFELYDAVCQRANVYPNENVLVSNLRRGRLLDALLSRNARAAVFASLSETEALAVGNQFVELLMARVGRADTNALIEGRLLLDELGMTDDVDRLLPKSAATPAQLLELRKRA
ncbi:hypothetical protein E2553_40265 [Paraburkholderia dipogonis]|uniref:Integrase n=1 Tax=Paraburkholderia dipogonis TaxID=1211383 RepID=A0A4Y8MJJ7_9BURK|nr:VPA1269 family protein [Paraburkholderia dipogonis]TFE37646.1 hypothetical protein E2553_40265 [Paraburkholderia dipogonis]